MTKAYYVTARDGSNRRTAWLCGPFRTIAAAHAMVPAVSLAARLSGDPGYQRCGFMVQGKPWRDAKPGTLSLRLLTHPDVLALIVAPRQV